MPGIVSHCLGIQETPNRRACAARSALRQPGRSGGAERESGAKRSQAFEKAAVEEAASKGTIEKAPGVEAAAGPGDPPAGKGRPGPGKNGEPGPGVHRTEAGEGNVRLNSAAVGSNLELGDMHHRQNSRLVKLHDEFIIGRVGRDSPQAPGHEFILCLLKNGLVVEKNGTDHLTEKGKELRENAEDRTEELYDAALLTLTEEEIKKLRQILKLFCSGISQNQKKQN
jgi:hypothetical protein